MLQPNIPVNGRMYFDLKTTASILNKSPRTLRREMDRRWYERNKERKKAYYAEHKQHIRTYYKEWYDEQKNK